jgi:hypothetical protein
MSRWSRKSLAGRTLAAGVMALAAFAGSAAAESADKLAPAAPPKCLKAEVNPVTGHVLCIDPIGAPVDPPPAAELPPCKKDERNSEAWSYGPKCKG